MINRNVNLTGTWTKVEKIGANFVYTDGLATRETDVLNATSVANGNFVSPNGQSISHQTLSRMQGSSYFGSTSSSNFSEKTGCHGYDPSPQGIDLAFSNAVYNKALGKLYEKLRGEVDLSVDFAQADQVVSMTRQASKALGSFASTVLEMKRHPARTASSMWLQWVYGVKPTLQSVYGSLDTLAKGANTGNMRIVVRASEPRSRNVTWNATGSTVMTRTKETSNYRCLIDCSVGVKDTALNTLAAYTSLNPVSIAYELLPYSFVLDWFIDIGGYLRNLESAYLYAGAFKRGFVTQGYKIEGSSVANGEVTASGQVTRMALEGSYRYTGKSRSVLASIPYPRPPRLKVNLGSSRLISAAALLQQKIK